MFGEFGFNDYSEYNNSYPFQQSEQAHGPVGEDVPYTLSLDLPPLLPLFNDRSIKPLDPEFYSNVAPAPVRLMVTEPASVSTKRGREREVVKVDVAISREESEDAYKPSKRL